MKINDHLKLFVYYCPPTQTWDVHEQSTGMRVGGGGNLRDAYLSAVDFFKTVNEDFFFEQLKLAGPAERRTEVPFETAMEYLTAGEKENPGVAMIRRKLNQKF